MKHQLRGRRAVLEGDVQLVIFLKMKNNFRGRRAVLVGDVQSFGFQELDSNVLKSALLDGYTIHVFKLVLTC